MKWSKAFNWLDQQIEVKANLGDIWNDHWNNHVRFYAVMQPDMTLCFIIKYGDIGFLKYAFWEVAIILQAPAAKQPKHANILLKQIHIIDTKTADPIL